MDRDCEVAGPSRPRKRSRMQLGSDEIPMALFDADTDLSSLSDSDTYQSVSTASQMDSSDSENEVATPSNVTANINWQDKPSNYTPKVYNFDSSNSGIGRHLEFDKNSVPYDYFRSFVTDDLVSKIVDYTNKFESKTSETATITRCARRKRWHDINNDEFLSFLGLTLLMPHVKKSRICDYWSTDITIETPYFRRYMTCDRYQLIMQFLHCYEETEETNKNDRLRKIRPILNIFQESFQNCLQPFQNLVVDESLILFKGRLIFKQYIPSKRHRFGMKLFMLCDCQTGIVLDIIVYTGTDIDIIRDDDLGVAGAVVKKLLQKHLEKGHTLYTDNWYTSPKLSLYLDSKNTGSCGTVRSNRKNMPKFVQNKQKVQEYVSPPLLAMKYKDKRDVHLLSTVHEGKIIATGKTSHRNNEPITKPDIIVDYNKNMRLVDEGDMMIGNIDCLRRTTKWYKKLLFHLFDICMLNAHHMYLLQTKKNMKLRDFSISVIREMLEKHGTVTKTFSHRIARADASDRLQGAAYVSRHHLEMPKKVGNRRVQKYCHVCKKSEENQAKKVSMWCAACKIPLCVDCFVVYHTKKNY